MTDPIVIAYVHPGVVRAEFCRSLVNTVARGGDYVHATLGRQSGPRIASARNDLVGEYLSDHSRRAPWLLMVDTDMVWSDDAPRRLVEAADPKTAPIVGGLCFAESELPEATDGMLPTMYELVHDSADGEAAFARYTEWPEDVLFPVAGTGAAFLLMHRDALKRVASGWGGKGPDLNYPWFREGTLGPRRQLGEDLTFCLRAQSAGIPVHVHTGVQVGHMKTHMLGKVV